MAIKTGTGNGMLEATGFLFNFCGEKKPDNGEDSVIYALNEKRAMVGAFDGCGGSGASQYGALRNKTGAYLASRATCAAYLQWFGALEEGQEGNTEEVKALILRYLRLVEENGGEDSGSKLMGRMSKKLPTTAAVAICRPARSGVDVQLHWAGDSRVYLLDSDGLAQLTESTPCTTCPRTGC